MRKIATPTATLFLTMKHALVYARCRNCLILQLRKLDRNSFPLAKQVNGGIRRDAYAKRAKLIRTDVVTCPLTPSIALAARSYNYLLVRIWVATTCLIHLTAICASARSQVAPLV